MNDDVLFVTKQLADAYNRKDWNAFADLLHPDAVFESPDEGGGIERYEGIEAILEFRKDWTAIIPDDQATFLSSRHVDDDRLVCEVIWSGTHRGKPFEWQDMIVLPSGKTFSNRGHTEYTMREGKILQITDQFDLKEFLAGFGISSS